MNDVVASLPIERLVPHREPMLWLQRVLYCDENQVLAEAVVGEDHLLLDGGMVPAFAGIEYMAQAIAAWAGARALSRGEAVKPGFLLGTRRYRASCPGFHPGQCLQIEGRRELFGENGLGMFACRILEAGEVLATANVSVFEPPDPDAFLGNSAS
ncbi:hypothetical protein [Arenimonas fontis]|uniref:3-hydroxylacyl-ACP dehydratase n=1 Tax=Arenimonas fontis TaxID=2608255 RepID=A0A5B2ZDD9_9GAMM|nr:hypothetical protein [Arenimonas fontis]KAA2285955.1 hypothetical protein F0415_00150 [Arenimonas fontis]